MAKGWNSKRRCPICDGSGWGKSRCRGFLHSDGSAVFCERPETGRACRLSSPLSSDYEWERTDRVISPFGIPLTCFRKIL